MAMERDTVLYKHIRKTDGIIFYIGIGNDKRPYYTSSRNTHWHNTVNKYDYDVEIIADGLTWDEACKLEMLFIAFYGRNDLGLGTLVNLTDGGDGTKNPSDKTRKKMSENNTGEGNPMYGKNLLDIWFEKYGEEKANEMWEDRRQESRQQMLNNNPHNNPEVRKKITKRWEEGAYSKRDLNGIKNGRYGKKMPGVGGVKKGTISWNKGLSKSDCFTEESLFNMTINQPNLMWVINLETGIFYTLDELVVILNLSKTYIRTILKGKRPNKTGFTIAFK